MSVEKCGTGAGDGLMAHSHDPRFNELLALAMAGDGAAANTLCQEFNVACNREGCGHESD